MAYTWCTTAMIQGWLDTASTIQIGDAADDNFSESAAQTVENAAVEDIERFLEPGWEIPLPTTDSYLQRLAAQLAAARIGELRMGAGFGGEMAAWTRSFRSDVYGALSRMIINQPSVTITGATKKTMTLLDRMLAGKTRFEERE